MAGALARALELQLNGSDDEAPAQLVAALSGQALLLVLDWLHVPGAVVLAVLLYGVAYFVLALRRVYAQGWLKTLAKSVLLAFAYSLTIAFALVLVSGVGAAFF